MFGLIHMLLNDSLKGIESNMSNPATYEADESHQSKIHLQL